MHKINIIIKTSVMVFIYVSLFIVASISITNIMKYMYTEKDECLWEHYNYYKTSCDIKLNLDVSNMDFIFCPYCGNEIKDVE